MATEKDFKVKNGLQVGNGLVNATTGDVSLRRGMSSTNRIRITSGNIINDTNVIISGNLDVSGNFNITGDINQTSVTTLDVTDKTITVANNAGSAANANGAGIIVDTGTNNPQMIYTSTTDEWDFNRSLHISGAAGSGVKIDSGGAIVGGGASGGDTQLMYWGGGPVYYGRSSLGGTVTGHEFRVGGTTKLNVDSSGDTVVSGNLKLTANDFLYTSSTNFDIKHTGSSQNITFHTTTSGGATSEIVRFTHNKRVGIGISSPDAPLHIEDSTSSAYGGLRVVGAGTGSGSANVRQIADFGRTNSGSVSGVWLGGRTDETTAVIGAKTASGNIAFEVYNSGWQERMRITNAGNVGIGTNNPVAKLHLESGSAHNKLSITSTANGGTGYDASIDLLSSAANSEVAINMGINGDADREQIKTYQSAMSFRTNNAERMRIDSSGNVGIGTSSPNSLADLHVADTSDARIWLDATSGNTLELYAGSGTSIFNRSNSFLAFGQDNVERMRINTGGNVGIGTTAPDTKLHIKQTSSGNFTEALRIENSGGGANEGNYIQWEVANTFGYGPRIGGRREGTGGVGLHFYTGEINAAPTEKMRLDHDGKVGIGTTSVPHTLSVKGTISRLNSSGIQVTNLQTNNDHGQIAVLNSGGVQKVLIDSNGGSTFNGGAVYFTGGNVGIGTSSPTHKLHVGGTPRFELTNGGLVITKTSGGTSTNSDYMSALLRTDSAGYHVTSNNGGFTSTANALALMNHGDLILATAPATGGSANYPSGRIMIKDTGNVGIGTSAPGHLLDILKTGSGDATVSIKSTTGGDPTIIFNSAAANRSGLIKYQDNGTNVGRIEYVHNGDRIDFQAGSATSATMSIANGKVGIGTTSPAQLLEVSGNAGKSRFTRSGSAGTTMEFFAGAAQAGGIQVQSTGLGIGGGTRENDIFLKTDGNVGIGLTNPTTQLHMKHASGPTLMMTRTSTNTSGEIGQIVFGNADWDSSMARIVAIQDGTNDGARLEFKTQYNAAGAEQTRMLINKSGKVGIGTTAPQGMIHVAESKGSGGDLWVQIGAGNAPSIHIQNTANAANTNAVLYFRNSSAEKASIGARFVNQSTGETELRFGTTNSSGTSYERMTLDGDGKLGIGTNNPSYLVHADAIVSTDPSYIVAGSGSNFVMAMGSQNRPGVAQEAFIGTLSNERFKVKVNNVEKATFTSTGLGIGTTAPGGPLHVDGHTGSSSTILEGNGNGDTVPLHFRTKANNGSVTNYGIFGNAGSTGTDNTILIGPTNSSGLTVNSSGNVGIGTTAPSSLLHIQSNDSTTNAAVNMMYITALSTGTTTTGFGPAIVFQAERNNGVNQNVGRIRSIAEVNSGTNISSGLSFETGTVGVLNESMRISYNGAVILKPNGITTGLRLQGRSSDNNFFIQWNNNTGSTNYASIGTDSGNDTLQYAANNFTFVNQLTNNEYMRIKSTGNVGIGVSDPGGIRLKVHSNDSDDYIAIFKQNHASNLGTVQIDSPSDSNARPSRLDFARGGVNKWKTGMVYGDTTNGWGLSDATGSGTALQQTRFIVTPGGNVGIGTGSPQNVLDVRNPSDSNQTFRVLFPNSSTVQIGTTRMASGATQKVFIEGQVGVTFGINGSEKARVHSNGQFGIGTQLPITKLHVEGDIGQQGTTDKSVSSGVGDSGVNIITGVHGSYARGSGRLRVMGTENNLNVGYAEYMYTYSTSSSGHYYINLKFIDESYVNNTYARPRLYLYNSSTYNNNATNRQNTNQSANSSSSNIGQIGITNVANQYGTFQIVAEPMHWKP